jgi:hypothetical protein
MLIGSLLGHPNTSALPETIMRTKRSKAQKDSTLGARLSSGLQRPMRSAKQPADSERGYNCRIRLRFNLVAQTTLDGDL